MAQGNPLGTNRYSKNESKGNQFNGTLTAEITFTDWLKMNISSNANLGLTNGSNYDNMLYGGAVSVNGRLVKSQSNTLRTNNSQTLNFHKLFGRHDVGVMAVTSIIVKTRYLDGTSSGSFSPSILDSMPLPRWRTTILTPRSTMWKAGSAVLSTIMKKIFCLGFPTAAMPPAASPRRTASGGATSGHWAPLGPCTRALVQGGLAQQPQAQGIHRTAGVTITWVTTITPISTPLTKASDTQMAPTFALLGNPNLTWETTTNFNVGVEFGILNNLVSGSLDVYNKKISDMLFWLSMPESVGTRGYYGNIGDMRNRGFELNLTVNPIRTRDINWTISGSISHNSTKILKLPSQQTMDYGGYVDNGTGNNCWYTVGGPLYNAFMPKYAGVSETGEALYYVDTSVPESDRTNYPSTKMDATTTDWNRAGRYTTGSLLPKASGGFTTSFSAYGFDASLTFDYQIGGKVYDRRYAQLMRPGTEAVAVPTATISLLTCSRLES